METTSYITLQSLPQRIRNASLETTEPISLVTIDEMEKELIQEALKVYGSSVKEKCMVAQVLGIGTATLYRKIKKYGLE
jgi:transcriptional regulator with PAS, ATPase and Fis domain